LKGVVGDVRDASEGIATATVEVAAGGQDLSVRTERAAANLQETSASMQQLSDGVVQTKEAARVAGQEADRARTVASDGSRVVGSVVESMTSISQFAKRIAEITGIIDRLAFQTNLLALNAAVEAARAGEQGRGFAVVAGEVRSLAGRSAEAAREIKAVIAASSQAVEDGSRLVEDAKESMSGVAASVARVSDIIQSIVQATTEQAAGISQINRAVMELDSATQHNAALVEESAAASTSMRDRAAQVTHLMAQFRIGA